MRWRLAVLVGVCVALWIDALCGGDLAAGTPALVVVAAVALASGLVGDLGPLAGSGLAAAALLSVADQVAEPGRFSLASDGVFYCVVVLAPTLVGWLVGSRNRQVRQLEARRRDLELRRGVAVRVARADERERVVRRIDLSLAERLRLVVAQSQSAVQLVAHEPGRVLERLEEIEATARTALAELREVLGTLHHAQPSRLTEPPAVALVQTERSRVRVDLIDAALVASVAPLAIETTLPGHHGLVALNLLAALAQGGALLLRRRPLVGVVVLLAVAGVQTTELAPLPSTVSWLLPGLIAAFLLGLVPSRRTAWAGLAALLAGVLGVSAVTPANHRASDGLVPGLVMGVLIWVGGRLVDARHTRADELLAITDELDRTRQDEARLAALDQRAEMARDLHDAGAHTLTVVCLQAGAALAWWQRDPQRARLALDSLVAVSENAVAQLGESLGGFAQGFAELDASVLEFIGIGRALGLGVDVGVIGEPRPVPPDIVQVAYRVVQEGLTNAARHAAGSTVRIGLAYMDKALEVSVSDTGASGAGVDITGTGSGLRGMRDRVEALRGELRAGPSDSGFVILARLPI